MFKQGGVNDEKKERKKDLRELHNLIPKVRYDKNWVKLIYEDIEFG